MAQTCSIETLDRSGRWYFTPGAKSIYDLRIRNNANNPLECSLILEDPPSGATVAPPSFTLRGLEVRTVTVTFAADATVPRTQRVLLSLRDAAGAVLATFEHPLIITGGSDCTISLAWKDALVDAGEVRGFELTCSVRSQSDGPTSFPLTFTPHASLAFPTLAPVTLDPGESAELTIPVRWDRTIKDDNGANHPSLLEIGVPVSNGRRTSRIRWDAIETQLQPFVWNPVLAAAKTAPGRNGDSKLSVAAAREHAAQPAQAAPAEPAQAAAPAQAAMPVQAAASTQAQASASAPPADQPTTQAAVPPPATNATNGTAAAKVSSAGNGASAVPAPAPPMLNGHVPVTQLPAAPPEPDVPVELPLFAAAPQPAPAPPADDKAVQELAAAAAAFAASLAPAETGFTAPARRENAVTHIDSGPTPRVRIAPVRRRKVPAGFAIAGLAAVALAVAAVLFRPWNLQSAPSVSPVVVNTPVAAANTAAPLPPLSAAHAPIRAVSAKAATRPTPLTRAASAAPAPTRAVATPAPTQAATPVARASAAPVSTPIAAAPAPQLRPRFARPFRRSRFAAPAGAIVAVGGLEAHYGAAGRAVRVNWSAAAQTTANVQLLDNHGTTVNSITVRGYRQTVLLYLPPRYRGSVTVQLTSTGRLGERVAQTAFLPPFGD